jgi:hypothetical protein
MIERVCNLWIERADFRCVPVSGAVREGCAVMDEGLAKEAAQKFHGLDADLGRMLTSRGNHAHLIRPGLVSFPVKQYQWSGANIPIITRSARELMAIVGNALTLLPRPVSRENDPPWEEVAKALAFLPDNIIIIQHV